MTLRAMVLVALAACGSPPATPDAAPVAIDASIDAPGPGLAISSTQHHFGSVGINQTSTHVAFVVSTGSPTGALGVSLTGPGSGELTTVGNCGGAGLSPQATCTVWVAFRPTSLGTKSATLLITGQPGGIVMAALLGTGTSGPHLTSNPSGLQFSTTIVGQSTATQRLTVNNPSVTTTSALNTTKAGMDPTQFEIITDTCMGQLVGPGATCFIDVRFHPTSVGQKTASIILSSTSSGSTNAFLDGAGILPPAAIAITSPVSDFGTIGIGVTSAPITCTATNTGGSPTAALSTSIVQTVNQFTIVAGTDTCSSNTLAPGASCTLQVRFTASQVGTSMGTLRVEDGTAVGMRSLSAVGAVVDDINIPSLIGDFPDVVVGGTSPPTQIAVSNIGGTTHGPIAINFSGADAAAFALVDDTCTGTSLAPGGFCTVGVTFSPVSVGLNTGLVQFAATPGGTATVALRGTGLP